MEHTPDGILLVDKAEGWTSHDVVARARRTLGTRKVGHAGTLDPMATGLLILGVGPSTRLLTHLVGLDKTYTATIRLGTATVTDDREGEALERSAAETEEVSRRITELAYDPDPIRRAAAALTGTIRQAPSAVSAIKVDGRRAYDRVRAGERVELKQRPVTVHEFEVGDAAAPHGMAGDEHVGPQGQERSKDLLDVPVTVRCSSGTYVRALARDLGEALGVGGHLIALRRTRVGPFDVADAHPNAALASDVGEGTLDASALLDPAEVAARLFPVIPLSAGQAVDLGHGKRLELDATTVADAEPAAAIGPDGRLIGLVSVKNGRTRVMTNFPQPGSAVPRSESDGEL